jgi:hypothetical protein
MSTQPITSSAQLMVGQTMAATPQLPIGVPTPPTSSEQSDSGSQQSQSDVAARGSGLVFPVAGYVGVPAKIAELYSQTHEAPKEFVYMDLLTLIGTVLSGRLEADFGTLNTQPRLYTLKIAKSGWSRKSTATRFAETVVQRAIDCSYHISDDPGSLNLAALDAPTELRLLYGVGSAEGLIGQFRHLERTGTRAEATDEGSKWDGDARIVLSFDEFRRFEKKAQGDSSVLLYAVNELFDRNSYDNATKGLSLSARNAHLGFIANTTDDSYRELLNGRELQEVGFFNRLFRVVSDGPRRRIPHPRSIETELEPLIVELAELFKKLPPVRDDGKCEAPIRLKLTDEADHLWADYYCALPETEATTRLDAIGPRLMGILAFVMGKEEIDAEVVRVVLTLLEYQHRVREAFQPIIGDTMNAKLENRIYQVHKQHRALSEAECKRHANGNRVDSRQWTAVYEQFRVRYLRRAQLEPGDRTERWELKPDAMRE